MVAALSPLRFCVAKFGEQKIVIVYRSPWRAKAHILKLVWLRVLSFGQARELYRGIV